MQIKNTNHLTMQLSNFEYSSAQKRGLTALGYRHQAHRRANLALAP